MTQGSTGGRGGMRGWKSEGWVYPLLKRVVRRALLEVLSRLNGATEGNIESITSVSLTYSPPLSLFLPPNSSNISTSVLSSLSLLALFFLCLRPSHERWSLSSQPIKLTAIIAAVADQKLWPLVGNVIYNGCNVPLLTAQWSHSRGRAHDQRARAPDEDLRCVHMPRHDRIPLTFGPHDSLLHRLYMKWRFTALKNFLLKFIPLKCYSHNCANRLQEPLLPEKTSFTLCHALWAMEFGWNLEKVLRVWPSSYLWLTSA